MKSQTPSGLSRRERQILEILYRLGSAPAADILDQMSDPPTYTTVRGLLRVLEKKGHVRHDENGLRYVYTPVTPKASAGARALENVVRTFFRDSPSDAMAALLGSSSTVSDEELRRIRALIDRARRER